MKHLKSLVCLFAAVIVFCGAGESPAGKIVLGYTGPLSGPARFAAKFSEQYKEMATRACALNYTATHALARAIAAAGTTTDVYKIREAFGKALAAPMLGDRFPNEIYGITPTGRVWVGASIQTITAGTSDPASVYIW
ncbi:MAG: hypothetical protein PHG54_02635 [Smithellaceae bacterium]|nr:hypothetical protein [Syntrophaceae bacterium]MDD4240302.1 hypothetical protein [Smithellaceae bacterium]NLX50972.1 hypothetical protein [Deltaproteobacteria bacterium]